jgi:RNA polymerase sigma-70 factor (ECF subfamily)
MPASNATEIDLVQRAARGDASAFTSLFERYFQSVYNYALSMCGDPAQAEDLTQEAFIRAHENLSKLGPPWHFRPWIFRMTRNLFIDLTRRSHPAEALDDSMPLPASGPSPESRAVIREVAERVRETLGEMSGKSREALVLRELHGLSYGEMAEVLDTTPAYVKTLLHRSRAQFQEAYGIRLLIEEPTEDCPEVAGLLHTLHDGEDLRDREAFVREHLKTCDACRERQRWLSTQSGLLAALVPSMPPPGLAERILRRTGGISGERARPKRGMETLGKPLLFGGALIVVALGWLFFSGRGGGASRRLPPHLRASSSCPQARLNR